MFAHVFFYVRVRVGMTDGSRMSQQCGGISRPRYVSVLPEE